MIHMSFPFDIKIMLNDKQCFKILKFMVSAMVFTAATGIAYLNLKII